MKFADVDGVRREAMPGLRAKCPDCEAIMISKCGETRIRHWAHLGACNCDSWWEPETEWHRVWKDRFAVECQEVRHVAPSGEVHKADVKTHQGIVLEFQHSSISLSERLSREQFYTHMIWIADGLRLKRDLPTFLEAIEYATVLHRPHLELFMQTKSIPILQRWTGGSCPIYLDFGDAQFSCPLPLKGPVLWRVNKLADIRHVTVTPITRRSFIEHYGGEGSLRGYRSPLRVISIQPRTEHLPGFERFLQREHRRMRNRRF